MDQATSLYAEATRLHIAKQYDEAEKIYDQLLTQNHDNAGLLASMGTLFCQTERLGLAISFLERSAKLKADGDVLCNLGIAYKQSGQYEKCKKYMGQAVKLNPSAETLSNYAALFINVGTPDIAIEHARKAIEKDKNHAMAHWNLAIGLLEKGGWETAWDEHEYGFGARMRIDRQIANVPPWDGSPGKRLHVYGEQGLGDEIMFSSMIPDVLKTNEIVLESHQRLKHLFEHSFGVKCYGTREEKRANWVDDEKLDARVSIGSLGKYYRRTRSAFPGTPYLKADPVQKGNKFRVGISWTGGLKLGRIRTREVPLPWWKSILNTPGCEFVSLQYTDCSADIERMENNGYSIREFDEIKAHDYYETARIVKSCDLVISVCTSVIHLAGALGVPCWVMVPSKPAWRYGVTGGMPWYRSVRLYRQTDSWVPVIERVGFDLSELLKQKEAA